MKTPEELAIEIKDNKPLDPKYLASSIVVSKEELEMNEKFENEIFSSINDKIADSGKRLVNEAYRIYFEEIDKEQDK